MNEGLLHRLIGAGAVILAAILIFPLLFDGEGYRERHISSKIPTRPEMPVVVEVEPQQAPLPDTRELPPADQSRQVKIERSASLQHKIAERKPEIDASEDTPALDQQQVPVAWTLQLASFKDEGNAKELRNKLVSAGHKVYSRQQGDLVKVFVGPDLQRSRLENLQARLQSDFGLNGIIVRFSTQ